MRKAQITVFVVLALILLIAVAMIFYIRAGAIKDRPPVENLEVTDDIKPIQTYVIECLSSISKEALIKLGQNSGYINVTGIKLSPIAYDSDALLFDPQVLPYWYHMRACEESNIGCIESLRPPLCDRENDCVLESKGDNSIESSLSMYVEQNLDKCINDFGVFKDRFDIREGTINVETKVKERDVEFVLDYPLEITEKGSSKKATIPHFVASHDVKFKDIYELASNITKAESGTNFLEHTTMNLVSIYSGVDKEKLPPISSLKFTANSISWTRTEVREMLQNDILPYMSFLRVLGTENNRQLMSLDDSDYSVYANGIYNNFELKLSNDTAYDLRVDFVYPYSDIYLNIGDSEIIKPDKLNVDSPVMKFIGFFMTEYKFKYDISYPVVIKITDPEAFNGEGYKFDFAMEANVRKNVPVSGNITQVFIGGVGSARLDSELQKVNRTITIESYDAHTGKALDGVIITYSCGENYLIGTTEMNNGKASLAEKYPFCQLGGQILFEKQGYMGSALEFNNPEAENPVSFKVELWPIQDKKFTVLKRTPANIAVIRNAGAGAITSYKQQATELSANETVFLTLQRIKENPAQTDIPLSGFASYAKQDIQLPTADDQKSQVIGYFNQGLIDEETKDKMLFDLALLNQTTQVQTIEIDSKTGLVPGRYVVDAFMMYRGNITIPKETRTICAGIKIVGVCTDEEDIVFPEQHFDTWISGAAKVNFTLTENDVYSDKKITFYVLEQQIPYDWRSMEAYLSFDDYQAGKTYLVRPRIE